jgi:hypothetical protein
VRSLRLAAWRLRRAVRQQGVLGVGSAALRLLRSLPARRRAARSSLAFDERYGVETAEIVHLGELDIDSPNRDLGVRYQPSDPDGFRTLMEELPIDYGKFVFVDYGSGKGRVLLLASEFPFKRIVGVEFAAELNEVARSNIARFPRARQRCAEIELVTADASDFEPPAEPAVLYFYNPFAEPVLARVLDRVRASVDAQPREVFLVFVGTVPLDPVAGRRDLEPVEPGSGAGARVFRLATSPSGSSLSSRD